MAVVAGQGRSCVPKRATQRSRIAGIRMTVEYEHGLGDVPSLSVALCTYNGARHLVEQLDSIAGQSVLPDELVINDDRSTDATGTILADFIGRVPFPVRVHVNAATRGAAGNFSDCIARCTGDVIVLSDQDDVWEPDRLERTQAAFVADPGLSYTFADAPLIDENDHPIGRKIFDSVPILRSDRARLMHGEALLPLILRYGVLYGATMAVRRRDVVHALPVPAGWSHDEWLSLVLSATGHSARMAPVMRYRQHAQQVVGAGNARLATTLQSARNRTAGHYDVEAERQRTGLAAARNDPKLATALAPHLVAKLRFIEDRAFIHKHRLTGAQRVLRHTFCGNYYRFAGGPRSILKDIALMVTAHRRHG